jgi:hypothetical protein
MARNIVIVSNNDNGDAFLLVELLQNAQNILGRARIQVASRFVCEQDRRPVYERTRDGDALLFAARHLRRFVVHAIAQPDESQKFFRALPPFIFRNLIRGIVERHQNVFQRTRSGQQIKILEDESDF